MDLLTLYLLAIGTLLASAAMMYWEHRGNPKRSKQLRFFAAGFVTLAVGCVAALFRHGPPGAIGSAISHLILLGGYLLILSGVASLSGRSYRVQSIALLIVMAAAWAVFGAQWHEPMWTYGCAIPVALVNALTAREMWRCDAMNTLHSHRVVVAVTGLHAALYVGRASVLPWLVALYGPVAESIAAKITIYEGVLYAILLSMALLKIMRDEAQNQLLLESQTDYLTRLGNRRWFFEEGARIVEAAGSSGPFSLLAFDLDRFKSINDQHGHHMGDQVLKSFAEIAKDVLGPSAVLARIGGEEFAALLSGDGASSAKAQGEAVVRRFAETVANLGDGIELPATVSVGLAQFDNDMSALADGLAAADKALYRAKSLGGNRLEVAATGLRSVAA